MTATWLAAAHKKWPNAFNCFWPPHHCDKSTNSFIRTLKWYWADKYAPVVEAMSAPISPIANTTAPILSAQHSETSPIAIVCATLDPGGAERQASYTAWALKSRGCPVVFVGYDTTRELENQHFAILLNDAGVPLINAASDEQAVCLGSEQEASVLREGAQRSEGLPLGLAKIQYDYFRLFVELKPRVVHAWLDYTNAVAGLSALWAGVPHVVLGLRNMNPMHFPLYQPFFRPFYQLMLTDPRTHLVANSSVGAADYARWLGIDRNCISIIPNACRFPAEQNGMVDDEPSHADDEYRPLILGVFRLYAEKDPLLFVRVAALVSRTFPQARFRIVGDGRLRTEVEAEACRLGIQSQLTIVENDRDVASHMREASLLLHTALFEGLPNVLLEAQSLGLPVVATDAGGAGEALEPGVTGVIVRSRSARAVARKVVKCIASPAWRAKASARGPQWIAEKFSTDLMLNKTLAAYAMPSGSKLCSGDRNDG